MKRRKAEKIEGVRGREGEWAKVSSSFPFFLIILTAQGNFSNCALRGQGGEGETRREKQKSLSLLLPLSPSPPRSFLPFALIILILSSASVGNAAPYFHQSDLVNIPTAEVAKHGTFSLGFFANLKVELGEKEGDELRRAESGLKIDLGLLDILETDLILLKPARSQSDFLLGNLKIQLTKENETIPNFAIGVDNFGEKVEAKPSEKASSSSSLHHEYLLSGYALVSKSFNLPILHLISGHLGLGNKRYSKKESLGKVLRGIFFGFDKDISPAFLRGLATFSGEVDGKDANLGLRYLTNSGIQIDIALSKLNLAVEDVRKAEIQIGVSFTNKEILKDLAETKKLSQQAVKIANEAKSGSEDKEEKDDSQ